MNPNASYKVNCDAIIVVTHSERMQTIEKTCADLGFGYIIPYGGIKLLARIFSDLLSTGKSSFGDTSTNDVIMLRLKRGQLLILPIDSDVDTSGAVATIKLQAVKNGKSRQV